VQPFGKGGHPPFGVLWPSADLYNEDKTFKSPDELRKMLAYLNVRPDQQIYTYCGGGVAASAPFFALKFILGYPNVKLYAESELGWISDPRGLPYWTYGAPYLLRDSAWLQWAGGQMVRTYLGSSVSIIDVRQPDAFAQGHVPFALNIPAGTFKAHAANPAGLATALGAAGVNPSDEAVVVSGAGLTPDAALVFVMLEALGQKQVSVLADSMDAWTRSGYSIAKTPTAVGPRKGPGDLSIEPVAYAAKPRTGVAVADARQTTGIYPKVFVASGAALPSQPPDGTVVHVPYTTLLNADGTPKPAADIWNTLKKAGVPRYAELVCVSDDAGEAAVNYVALKLMGYPDVKVQTGVAR
jgi:3-mercaptopyruvate sulfurtransferase SseA